MRQSKWLRVKKKREEEEQKKVLKESQDTGSSLSEKGFEGSNLEKQQRIPETKHPNFVIEEKKSVGFSF